MEHTQLMHLKQRIAQTTNSAGWNDVVKLMEESVKKLEREAIDEEDDTKGNQLRREAKAARKFLTDFMKRINSARQFTDEPGEDDWLDVAM